ncbi:MAG: hypothetical protein MJB57_06215 [Gemmatimonadetes bacterium]|nr:hypothetical protein [Gemmatimonadota bacterium]
MSDPETAAPLGSEFLWRALALGAGGAGVFLIGTGRGSLSLAILLLIVALAASGVLIGSGAQGPEAEGRLDLSARLGLGLLGGAIGAIASAVAIAILLTLGIPAALGVALPSATADPGLLAHVGSGAVWGMVLGILYVYMPGTAPSARGALFSLVPTLYLLLKVYPVDRDLGYLGIERGTLTFLFVMGMNLLWGWITGATIGWGEIAEEAPVARPIDA